jgi:hypothetical protein
VLLLRKGVKTPALDMATHTHIHSYAHVPTTTSTNSHDGKCLIAMTLVSARMGLFWTVPPPAWLLLAYICAC